MNSSVNATANGAADLAAESPTDPPVPLRAFPLHGIVLGPACACPLGTQCKSIGKHPMVPWRIYDGNTKGPGGGYGIQTGRFNGIFVVDRDVRPAMADQEAKDGRAELAKLAAAAGGEVPPTQTVDTPSGGDHLYFRLPHGVYIPTSCGELGPGIDVKGEGGYVVGPDSPHRNGGTYRIRDESAPLADPPDWLLALVVRELPPVAVDADGPALIEPATGEGLDRGRRRAIAHVREVGPCVEGQDAQSWIWRVAQYLAIACRLPVEDAWTIFDAHYNPMCFEADSQTPYPWQREGNDGFQRVFSRAARSTIAKRSADAEASVARLTASCASAPSTNQAAAGTPARAAPTTNGTSSGDSAGSGPTSESDDKAKLADQVIHIVVKNADLFHDPSETAHALVTTHGVRRVLRLRSPKMHAWIARTVHAHLGRSVSKNAIDQALCALEGLAVHDCDEREVHLRVAEHDGAIYVDLGDTTGECIEVTASGWRVLQEAPVLFRRPDAMRALPRPVAGGSLADLRPFVNAADDDAFHLLLAWLVTSFRPGRPFPILAVHGEQGTAKSTVSRVARTLIDPNASPVRSAPRTEDDLAVAAVHSHVVAFDNLSGVKPWLSDALCRLATGGGLSKRTHYTNDDETVLDAIRPVVVNGIDDVATRGDLAERCLVLILEPIPKRKRRDEEAFWRDFSATAPRILGYLLDGVASALHDLPSVQVEELPRMADFAKWIAAAEPGLRLAPGTLLAAYARNQAKAVNVALDASPVATAVRKLLDQSGGTWTGEPSELLAALGQFIPEAVRKDRASAWPMTANGLSVQLRRSAAFLRGIGVTLDLDSRAGRGDDRHRLWTLVRVERPEVGTRGDDVGTLADRGSSPLAPRKNGSWGRGDDGDADLLSLGQKEKMNGSNGTPRPPVAMPCHHVAKNIVPVVPASPTQETKANERGRPAISQRPQDRRQASPSLFARVCWRCATQTIDEQGRCTKCGVRKSAPAGGPS